MQEKQTEKVIDLTSLHIEVDVTSKGNSWALIN